jgi:TRAP-type C4-dicarboxylate transport system permease small subunit
MSDVTTPTRPPYGGRVGRRLAHLTAAPARALNAVAAPLIVALILLTGVDVLLRNTGFDPIRGAVEYTEVLLVLLVYFGIAEAERTESHVAMSLVTDRMPAPVRQLLLLIGGLLLIAFLVVLTWSTGQVAIRSVATWEARFGTVQVPVWPARALIPIAFTVMAGQTAVRMAGPCRELVAHWRKVRHVP